MSRIRRLSVRGIRNFGDDSEEATIRFSRPLTLILGPNGTGKTTIIEALKFATCGEFPPGSDRGKYFIHDPTLTSTSSVIIQLFIISSCILKSLKSSVILVETLLPSYSYCAVYSKQVRGVVRAEIIDVLGNLFTICRTIEATKTNMTVKFKTLDSALSRVNKGTKEVHFNNINTYF